MKIKLADGTEAEVADDSQLAIAAREVEKVKALGFDSVTAYQEDVDAKVSKLEKHNQDNDDFINRQKTTIGDLRKENESLKGTGDDDDLPPKNEKDKEKSMETTEVREERFQKENLAIQAALTEEERTYADDQYREAYTEATPETRTLLQTEEGKREFFKMVFPTKQETETTPITLFSKPAEKQLSTAEQVRMALEKDDRGRSRRPVIPTTTGSGYTPGRKQADVGKVSQPIPQMSMSGGVVDALRVIDKNK